MLILVLSCCFLGIGYASIANINLDITGTAALKKQTGVAIKEVTLSDDHGSGSTSSINNYYQTLLDSTVVLNNDSSSYVTYEITIKNLSNNEKEFKGVVYDQAFYDNPAITYEINGLDVGDTLDAGEEVTFTVKFKYAETQASYDNTTLNSVLNFKFETTEEIIDEETYEGKCIFNGQGQDVVGDCARGEHVDYIDTGIQLFSEDNYLKDFEIGFTIDNIDPSRFRDGQVDAIFTCLQEKKPYPGITLRIQDSKWLLQIGSGVGTNTKLVFEPDAIQSFKIYRTNGDVYYQINGGDPVFVKNLTTLSNTFDDPLIFGTSLENGSPMASRYFIGELSDFYVKLIEPGDPVPIRDYDTVDQEILDFLNEPMNVVFNQEAAHTWDGDASSCFNTNVALFSETNYQKSFVITFELDNVNVNGQSASQATLINAKDESGNGWPGVMMRKQGSSYTMSAKDGASVTSTVTIPATVNRVNIIKKGMKMYYQTDLGVIQELGESNNLSSWAVGKCFNTGTTFGSIINGSGNYDRILKGTLSHMKIQLGN